jgi:tetraacyldisaccharide 4'-kinase
MSWHTPKHWREKNLTARLLYPLGLLFFGLQGLNYLRRAYRPYRAGVPVISIGNLTAGGSGKTPVALNLARFLSQQGETVALISHGYGSSATAPEMVTPDSPPALVGDEAIEMAQAYAAAQVWSGGEREDCCEAAVKAGASVLILDDAFSNPSIVRDLDLLVVDSLFGFGNGWPLPAGPMREPLGAQYRAAAAVVLQQGSQNRKVEALKIPQVVVHVEAAATLPNRPVVAFCGLGLPDKFYAHLRAQGLRLATTLNFPDHHAYTEKDLDKLRAAAKAHNAVLVTTAKDAVKLPRDFMQAAEVYVAQLQLNEKDMTPVYSLVVQMLQRSRVR